MARSRSGGNADGNEFPRGRSKRQRSTNKWSSRRNSILDDYGYDRQAERQSRRRRKRK